jgi:predicted permease
MLEDLRFAVRLLRKYPGFTLVAVVTLALGLGASSTVFTYFDAAYLRGLAVSRPNELIYVTTGQQGGTYTGVSNLDYLDYRQQGDAFQGLAVYGTRGGWLELEDEAQSVTLQMVSGNYFPLLGVKALLGRTLLPEDDRPSGAEPAVFVSYGLWRQRLGGRADAVGRVIRLNFANFTVVGVAPPSFRGLNRFMDVALWVPLNQRPLMLRGGRQELDARQFRWLEAMVGRLKAGASLTQAERQLGTIAQRLAEAYPKTNEGWNAAVSSEADRRRRAVVNQGAYLMGMVALVLLIACANVANLLLAHADARRRETAVRLALGAGRARILRQVLAQSVVLSLVGAAAGMVLSAWLVKLLPLLMPRNVEAIRADVGVDARVMVFTLLASLAAAALLGIVPALRAARPDLAPALKGQASFGVESRRRLPVRSVLVVTQVAVSVALLGCAGLLRKSFLRTLELRPGFDARKQIAHFMVVPSFHGYRGERLASFYEELRRRLERLPGVKQATYAARMPLDGVGSGRSAEIVIPGHELPPGADGLRIRCTLVGPNYFNTLGTRLRAGRPVDERDTMGSLRVAVINEAMARRFWPGQSPEGRSFWMGKERTEVRIIGIAEDTRIRGLHEAPEPYLFLAAAQSPDGEATYALETAGDPVAVMGAVKAAVRDLEKGMSILRAGTMAELLEIALYDERLAAWLVGSLALLGLVLGAVGLYGVMALATGRRTREVGIRMALGATHARVLTLVIRQGLALALAGVAAGLAGSVMATRWIASRLHGVSRLDPATFAAVAVLLLVTAALASFIPAWRAARVSPVEALRYE